MSLQFTIDSYDQLYKCGNDDAWLIAVPPFQDKRFWKFGRLAPNKLSTFSDHLIQTPPTTPAAAAGKNERGLEVSTYVSRRPHCTIHVGLDGSVQLVRPVLIADMLFSPDATQ